MSTSKLVFFSLLAAAMMALTGTKAMATEKPDYTVTQEIEGKIERRTYPSMLLAEVTVSGDRGDAANAGFRILANYIFGGNESGTKIAMTSPVMQVPMEPAPNGMDDEWIVNFMMPSKFSMDTLPATPDGRIRFYTSEPYEAMAIRFSGRGKAKDLTKHKNKLEAYAASAGISLEPTPLYAFYNAPFVPGFARRNEVIFKIKAAPVN